MKSLNFIRSMTAGENYKEKHVLVLDMTGRTTKTGKPFVMLKVTDGDASVNASLFDTTIEDMRLLGIAPGEVAEVSMCLKAPYYNLTDIVLSDDPEISVEDFARTVPGDVDRMFDEIYMAVVDSIDLNCSTSAAASVALELLGEYEEAYKRSSAAKCMHHNLMGGLIYHSYRMVMAAQKLCEVYDGLDKEVLISAAALHDIGKIRELSTNMTGDAEYTVEGRLFGHALIGIQMIEEKARELGLRSDRIMNLEHCLASHHGKQEYGAIVEPATSEAEALHIIDLLDARMYQFENAYVGLEEGALSGKIFNLDGNTVFRPYHSDFTGNEPEYVPIEEEPYAPVEEEPYVPETEEPYVAEEEEPYDEQ